MTILAVYSADPGFPPADQAPGAQRSTVGGHVVDYTGSAPSTGDVSAFLNPSSRLSAYADATFARLQAAGLSVDIAASGTPVIALVSTSAEGKVDVTVLTIQAHAAGSGWSSPWYQSAGTLTINATQLGIITTRMQTFTEQLLAAWTQAMTGIASGIITTTAQVDALAWPIQREGVG